MTGTEIGFCLEGDQSPALIKVERVGDADQPFYVQKDRIRSGRRMVTGTSRRPIRAGIDPNRLLIEVVTADNATTITTKP